MRKVYIVEAHNGENYDEAMDVVIAITTSKEDAEKVRDRVLSWITKGADEGNAPYHKLPLIIDARNEFATCDVFAHVLFDEHDAKRECISEAEMHTVLKPAPPACGCGSKADLVTESDFYPNGGWPHCPECGCV